MDTFGVVYLLGALIVAIGWGTGLAAVTSVVSAVASGYFRDWPDDSFDPTTLRNWVVIGVFLVVTLMANSWPGWLGPGRPKPSAAPSGRLRCDASRPWWRRVFHPMTCSQQ